MKKVLFIYFVLLLFLFFKTNVNAAWEYYENNPVLSPSADSWDNGSVSVPSVIYDQYKLRMWYQGQTNNYFWGIGLAESSDGLSWTKTTNQPLITAFSDPLIMETDIGQPTVVKNDLYRMWYTSYSGTNYFIRYATSVDGVTWQKYPTYILIGTEPWENRGVTNPYVIYKDGQYWMWYQAWGNGDWKIGFAQSQDGINWQKNPGNPLNLPTFGSDGGPGVIFWKDVFHMWYTTFHYTNSSSVYHVVSPDGINWQCQESCETFTTNSNHFNSQANYTPRPVLKDNNLYLYFAGNDGITTQIGLYRFIEDKIPIVILPGFFASWNKNALIYNQNVSQLEWKLFSRVKEYDGLISSLKNLGYKENQEYLIFSYDWRKSINQTADDLNNFLNQKVWAEKPNQKINLVGHSLGGLISRIWQQKYNSSFTNKIVTVGAPHLGVVQAYKPLAAGDLDRENTLMWLAEKLILLLNKSTIESDKTTIRNKFPVLYDLLPTFNYLKDINNNEISIFNLSLQNNLLNSYNSTLAAVIPCLKIIYGENIPTLSGFKIQQRTTSDQLFDQYNDGRPIESYYESGDQTVVAKSASQGMDTYQFNLDHGELIANKNTISKILSLLQIDYQDDQIIEGSKTILSPSLIFLSKSPIGLTVNYKNQLFHENDEGIIFISNAQPGNYQLQIQGINKGTYEIDIMQIATNNELFEKYFGEITSEIPQSQVDIIDLNFNSDTAINALPSSTPSPSIFPTTLPTPISLSMTPPISPTLIPTTIPTIPPTVIYQGLTPYYQPINNQIINNVAAPTVFINNVQYPDPTTVLLSSNNNQKILGENTSILQQKFSNNQNEKIESLQTTSKNENSLNNLWRIIFIILAGGIISCVLYKKYGPWFNLRG